MKRSTPQSRIVATWKVRTRGRHAFKRGLETIRAGRYFEAHEELEQAWRAAAAEERDFFQGLVHVAVAWYQAGRGQPRRDREAAGEGGAPARRRSRRRTAASTSPDVLAQVEAAQARVAGRLARPRAAAAHLVTVCATG